MCKGAGVTERKTNHGMPANAWCYRAFQYMHAPEKLTRMFQVTVQMHCFASNETAIVGVKVPDLKLLSSSTEYTVLNLIGCSLVSW